MLRTGSPSPPQSKPIKYPVRNTANGMKIAQYAFTLEY